LLFPAVMVAAIIMAGFFESPQHASDVALGATTGMLGCTVCVLTSVVSVTYLHNWALSLVIATVAWFLSSVVCIRLVQGIMSKS